MGRPIEGGDAYENAILRPERNVAPRLQAGWAALVEVLADGEEHDRETCIAAMVDTGLAERTALNLLEKGVRYELITARRARVVKGTVRGRVLAVSKHVGYRLVEGALGGENDV